MRLRLAKRRFRARQFERLASVALISLMSGIEAHAQTVAPAAVTPPSLAPQHSGAGVRVEIPQAGALEPPAGSENLSVTLADLEIDGGFSEVADKIQAVLQPLRGRQVSLKEIYAAASEIEAIHARAGYILARVSVPPQALEPGGRLRIVVTDGFIETVDVSALPPRVRQAVAARVATLEGRRHLRLSEIERALLIAGDTPGLTLRSTLARGDTAGGAKIVLEGEHQLVSGSFGVDNQLDPSLGRSGVNVQLALNSALGLGEQLYGFSASSLQAEHLFASDPIERVLGGGAMLPLGEGRFTLNPEYTSAVTSPKPSLGAPATIGDLRRATVRAVESLIRTQRQQLGVTFAIEQIDETNKAKAFAALISHDRYMAVRPSALWSLTTAEGATYGLTLQLSRGLSDLGARTEVDAVKSRTPFSRIGAKTDFGKLNLGGHASFPVMPDLAVSITGRAQSSFGEALFRAEQTSLEGADGLSAYVGGRTAVDKGWVVRAEAATLVKALENPLVSGVTPYVFAAQGDGKLSHPTALERGEIRATNLGAGFRATLAARVVLIGEFAHGVSSYAPLDKVERANLSLTVRF